MTSTSHSRPAQSTSTTSQPPSEPSYFEAQRAELVQEIAHSLEQVLQNINRLNRSLEGIIAVGNEFSSAEALWSQFEGVMGRDAEVEAESEAHDGQMNGNGGADRELDSSAVTVDIDVDADGEEDEGDYTITR